MLAVLICFPALGQVSVEFGTMGNAICPGEKNEYTATSYMDSKHQEADTYVWDFDNGHVRETSQPSVEYAYPKGGAYMARITAIFSDGSTATATQPIQVGVPPDFGGFRSDIDGRQNGICLGETATLAMPIASKKVTYRCMDNCNESTPQSIYNAYWIGSINLKSFGNRTIASAQDIEAVSVTYSTDRQDDIRIELMPPDGRTVMIKDFGTGMKGGEAVDSKVKNMMRHNIDAAALAGQIEGCPINGDWKFRIESRGLDNEAYVAGAEIRLSAALQEEYGWVYNQEYDLRRAVWSGRGVSATTQGTAKATPTMDGNTRYVFSISDNLGCLHDTATYVTVERASFAGADSSVFIGDEINFENKTSWAAETSWSFGDKSEIASGGRAPHAYYEKNKYVVIMQARSARGCVDVDTQIVSIVPRPLEVKEVNIFTPNGDGVNDVFTFFNEKESFLSNGGLTKMPANIRSIRGKIYNIYGQTVYKWDEVEASIFGWDGTWHNKGSRDCPPGTYFYDIIVYGKDGNSLKRTGSIMLYRCK